MLETTLIRSGIAASQQMERMLTADLHPIIWRHDPADQRGADLRDYVIGAARSIRTNLNSALVHLSCYEEARYKLDNAVDLSFSSTGTAPNDARSNELAGRLNGHQQGLFAALGAALDCTAAVCVAVSGLRMNVQRAQMPTLLPKSDAADFPTDGRQDSLKRAMRSAPDAVADLQRSILTGISGAYTAAGPPGWLRWMLDARNTAVHREQPTSFIFLEGDRKTGRTIHRNLHRHPQLSNLQSMRSPGINNFILSEDARTTMRGCIRATSDFTHGIGAVVEAEWSKRRIALDIRVPIDDQWEAGAFSAFDGFNPGSASFMPRADTVLVMNPNDTMRLQAGGVLDK